LVLQGVRVGGDSTEQPQEGSMQRNRGEVEDEAQVLVFYARMMESVQQFEWSLKGLAIQKYETMEGLGFDSAWRRALKAMSKAIGALEGHVPAGLADEVRELRELRNKVAHEILLVWRLETSLGLVDHATVADGMFETAERFDRCRAEIDALAERHQRALGIEPSDLEMDRDELLRALEEEESEPREADD
jgi:hypothetical protein